MVYCGRESMTKVSLAIKLVIFSVFGGRLKVFLPDSLLPAGVLERGESLDEAAKIIFKEKLGLSTKECYLEQLYTFSDKNEIAIVYYILVPYYLIPTGSGKKWVNGDKIMEELPDGKTVRYAIQRLRWKVEYTNVVYSLLPVEFTFGELQTTYEAILGRTLDKRNFRKKILCLNILKSTGHKKTLGKARPAEMFSFRKRKLTMVEIL